MCVRKSIILPACALKNWLGLKDQVSGVWEPVHPKAHKPASLQVYCRYCRFIVALYTLLTKGVALLRVAGFDTALEPAHTLRRGTVGKGIGSHLAA